MKRIAIIPARGGSRRLHKKNIKLFGGKPIMQWTIEAAKKADLFDEILVSSEDDEVLEIAYQCEARPVVRDSEVAAYNKTVVDVCLNTMLHSEKQFERADQMCCLYATSPLRTANDIRATVNLLQPTYCDFSMAVTHFDLPPNQALISLDNKRLTPRWPNLINNINANQTEYLVDNGSTYAVSIEAFKKTRSFYGPTLRGHIMPKNRSIDINDQADFDRALSLAKDLFQGMK
jgi:CMP-N-acetylneuraminic acid synthetase